MRLLLAPCLLKELISDHAHGPTKVSHDAVPLGREVCEERELESEDEHEIGENAGAFEREGVEGSCDRRVFSV